MKKLIFIITILALSFGCKKGDFENINNCNLGGIYYHYQTISNGNVVSSNNNSYVVLNGNYIDFYSSNGMFSVTHKIDSINALGFFKCTENSVTIGNTNYPHSIYKR